MISVLAFILGAFGAIFLCFAAVAFFRAKDLFVMLQIIKISNFYIFPLILLAIALENFSLIVLLKIFVVILLNIISSNLLCYLIAKRALINKIVPDADKKSRSI